MKKTSLARLIANQRNATQSTGPRSPEGKQRSALNALDHGLCAQALLLPGESAQRLDQHFSSIESDLAPRNYLETLLARRVASASWRLLRADHFESSLVQAQLHQSPQRADSSASVAAAWADSRAHLATRYEDRHQHHLHRSLRAYRELTLLRGPASPAPAAPPNQAFTPEYPQKPNEPNAENAHPTGGDREPKAA